MSFLAIRGKCTLQLSTQVNTVSTAPVQSVYNNKQKNSNSKRKKRLRHGLGGSYALGVDSSWHGGRSRTSEELSRADRSLHGPGLNTLGVAACWAGLKAYGFIAPAPATSQPRTDADKAAFFSLLTPPGSTHKQAAALHAHLEALMCVLKLWPVLHEAAEARKHAALRSWGYAGKVQHQSSWPLAGASFAFGACAFLPVLASYNVREGQLQQAALHSVEVDMQDGQPPSPSLRRSCDSLVSGMRAAPLPALPPVLLAAALSSIHQAMVSAGNAWASYSPLLSECKLVRAPTMDFLHITAQHTEDAEDGSLSWDRSDTWLPALHTLHAICPATLSLLLPPTHPKHPRQLATRLYALLRASPTKLSITGGNSSSSGGGGTRSSSPAFAHRSSSSNGAAHTQSSKGGRPRRSSCSGTLHSVATLNRASCDGSSNSNSSTLCRSRGSSNSGCSAHASSNGGSSSSSCSAGAATTRSALSAPSPLGKQQQQHRRSKSSVDLHLCGSDMPLRGGSPQPYNNTEEAQLRGVGGAREKGAQQGGSGNRGSGGLWAGAKCLAYQLVVPAY